jgi:hypothetical protein
MGNRVVVTVKGAGDKTTGIYVHWNVGVNSIEAFCTYCDMMCISFQKWVFE